MFFVYPSIEGKGMPHIIVPDAVLHRAGLNPEEVATTACHTDREIELAAQAAAALREDRLQKACAAYTTWLATWSAEPVRNNTGGQRPRLSVSTFEKAKSVAQIWFGLIEMDQPPQLTPKIFGPMRAKFKSICHEYLLSDLLEA